MKSFRSLTLGIAALGLVVFGCAHAGSRPGSFDRDQWSRELTRKGIDPTSVVYPFETTAEMKSWVEAVVRPYAALGSVRQLEALQRTLFDGDYSFSYDSNLTLTAAEAFEQRHGNCMSFTALFIAMARSAGIPTFLMSVQRDPDVDKEDGLVIVNRHVVAGYRGADSVMTFDFYLSGAGHFVQQRVIDDVLATAMYHNNLGSVAIRKGDIDEALRNLEIATTIEPDWPAGWVNLGVARFRTGDEEGALAAYSEALRADSYNPSALTNMAYVYRHLGMAEESETALRAAAHRTTNPYTLIAMADAEIMQGKHRSAQRYLKKARRSYPSEPEVYDALARLARLRGEGSRADRYSRQAAKLRKQRVDG